MSEIIKKIIALFKSIHTQEPDVKNRRFLIVFLFVLLFIGIVITFLYYPPELVKQVITSQINQVRLDTAKVHLEESNTELKQIRKQAEDMLDEAVANNQPLMVEKCKKTVSLINKFIGENDNLLLELRSFSTLTPEQQEILLQKVIQKFSSDQRQIGKIDFGIMRKEQHYAEMDIINQSLEGEISDYEEKISVLEKKVFKLENTIRQKDSIISDRDKYISIIQNDYTAIQETTKVLKNDIKSVNIQQEKTKEDFNIYRKEAEDIDDIKITSAAAKSKCSEIYPKKSLPMGCVRSYGVKIAYKIEPNNHASNPKINKINKTGTVYILIQPPGESYSNPLPSNYVVDGVNEFNVPLNLITKKGVYKFVIRKKFQDERELYSGSYIVG